MSLSQGKHIANKTVTEVSVTSSLLGWMGWHWHNSSSSDSHKNGLAAFKSLSEITKLSVRPNLSWQGLVWRGGPIKKEGLYQRFAPSDNLSAVRGISQALNYAPVHDAANAVWVTKKHSHKRNFSFCTHAVLRRLQIASKLELGMTEENRLVTQF